MIFCAGFSTRTPTYYSTKMSCKSTVAVIREAFFIIISFRMFKCLHFFLPISSLIMIGVGIKYGLIRLSMKWWIWTICPSWPFLLPLGPRKQRPSCSVFCQAWLHILTSIDYPRSIVPTDRSISFSVILSLGKKSRAQDLKVN